MLLVQREKEIFQLNRPNKRFVFFRIVFLTFVYISSLILSSGNMYGLVNGVFNETWTHSYLQFEWFSVGFLFLCRSLQCFSECLFTPIFFTPHLLLIWNKLCVYVCVCVCVCFGVVSDFTDIFSMCKCECVSWNFSSHTNVRMCVR